SWSAAMRRARPSSRGLWKPATTSGGYLRQEPTVRLRMTPACSMNRIAVTMRGVVAAALSVGALVAAAPAFAQTPATIESGVTIHTVDVGGMTADEAKAAVHDFATTPFTLSFRTRTLHPAPWSL